MYCSTALAVLLYVVVVDQLALRGYEPHFDELLLRLNFSKYYKTTSTSA